MDGCCIIPRCFFMVALCKMENQPVVSEKQGFETATLLKKGKYGFYKQIDKIHSVYGDEPTIPQKTNVFTEDKPHKKAPETFSAFKPASETNHYLYPEKFNEFIQGFFAEKVKPFWSIGKEGFGGGGLEESAESATKKIDESTQAIQEEGDLMLKRLEEVWIQIEDDVKIIGNEESTQSEKLHGFFSLLKDFLLLFYTLFSVFNVNTHPNLIDIIGETLTKMFVETDTGGLFDPEKSRIAIGYFTMIAYASVFIFIAYIASENFYYFLFYEFGENIMTDVINEKGDTEKKEWSLGVWWSYYEKKRPNIFGLIHAVFYMVTMIDTLLRRLRENTKGKSDDYSPILRILIFLAIYYLFNYMVTLTGSPVFEIIFMIVLVLAVFMICIKSYGSLGFAAASTSYAPSLFNIVITIIKIIVLFMINYALMPIGKLAVYIYIIFISFGIISFSETKRTKRGMIGRFLDTTREMRDYLLLTARINSNNNTIISSKAHFIEKSWLSFSVIIVFLIMLFTLIPNIKDVQNFQMFAPILYFILIFWGISIVKIFMNIFFYEPFELDSDSDLRSKIRSGISSSLSQGYKYVDGVIQKPET